MHRAHRFPSLALLLLSLCGCGKPAALPAPTPLKVNVAPVLKVDLPSVSRQIAEAIPDHSVNLVARVEGFLIKSHFKAGQMVKAGALLYEIEPAEYEAELALAQANLDQAEAEQRNCVIEFERQKQMLGKDATAKRLYDTAETNMHGARAKVDACRAKVATAKLKLSYTKIYAPFDGQIGLERYKVGNLVNLAAGTLATVTCVDPMRVQFVVGDKERLNTLRLLGDTRNFEMLYTKLTLENGRAYPHQGKITFWDNHIDPNTGTLTVQSTFPNPDKETLKAGMYLHIAIVSRKKFPTLLIPAVALSKDMTGSFVYVATPEKRAERRKVTAGDTINGFTIIESGLKAGETVVADGVQKLRNNVPLEPTVVEKYTVFTEPVQP